MLGILAHTAACYVTYLEYERGKMASADILAPLGTQSLITPHLFGVGRQTKCFLADENILYHTL